MKITGKKFDWKKGVGYSDASYLGIKPGEPIPNSVEIVSHITGAVVPFYFDSVSTMFSNNEFFRYESRNGHTLIIFND